MKTLLYLAAIAMTIGAIVLMLIDAPFEAQYPWAWRALLGVGLLLNVTLYLAGRSRT